MAKAAATPDACGGGHGIPALSVEEARARIIAELRPVSGVERVALRSALGRVSACDIRAPFDVPSHTNSAMDGYALRAADLPAAGAAELKVIGTAWAGRPFDGTVTTGQCVRVMTGASLPGGADTVVLQEQVEQRDDTIHVRAGHKPGSNVRVAGEDLRKGAVVLTAGVQLMPPELGMLASIGVVEVHVRRRLRVAFFSTGDELRSLGEPLASGEIYDSNRYTLYGVLARLGVDILDMGVVRDDPTATRQAFVEAAESADVLVTSGGVSVGAADYVKATLDAIGKVSFWQIAVKPGRPLAFGRVGDAVFFGLPGNPVSVMVTFHQFVAPALRYLMGQKNYEPPYSFKVPCASRFKKGRGRTEFQRGILQRDESGALVVRSTGRQGSGLLHSMSMANCFVILPAETDDVEPGMLVDVQPFYGVF